MSRQRITLKPQGAIPRDLGLTIKMQKSGEAAVVGAAGAGDSPLELHLDVGPIPWAIGRNSYAVVWTNEIQPSDLTVTLTIDDPTIFQVHDPADAPGVFGATATAIIPAGERFVNFLTLATVGSSGTTFATATADGYDPVTATMTTFSVPVVQRVRYKVWSSDNAKTVSVWQYADNAANNGGLTITYRGEIFIDGMIFLDRETQSTDPFAADYLSLIPSATGNLSIGSRWEWHFQFPTSTAVIANGPDWFPPFVYNAGDTYRLDWMLGEFSATPVLLHRFTFTLA